MRLRYCRESLGRANVTHQRIRCPHELHSNRLLSQHMRVWYLSHCRVSNMQTWQSLRYSHKWHTNGLPEILVPLLNCRVQMCRLIRVSKGAKIRNRYNQVPHLTQDTNGNVTNSQKTPQTEPRGQPFPSR